MVAEGKVTKRNKIRRVRRIGRASFCGRRGGVGRALVTTRPARRTTTAVRQVSKAGADGVTTSTAPELRVSRR
jgi:hypothetical protein